MSTFNDAAPKMGKFGQNWEIFENPLIFRVLRFSQRAKKKSQRAAQIP